MKCGPTPEDYRRSIVHANPVMKHSATRWTVGMLLSQGLAISSRGARSSHAFSPWPRLRCPHNLRNAAWKLPSQQRCMLDVHYSVRVSTFVSTECCTAPICHPFGSCALQLFRLPPSPQPTLISIKRTTNGTVGTASSWTALISLSTLS